MNCLRSERVIWRSDSSCFWMFLTVVFQVRVLQNLVKALDDDGIVFFLAHLRKFVSLLRYTGGRTDVGRALKTRMRPNARRSDPRARGADHERES